MEKMLQDLAYKFQKKTVLLPEKHDIRVKEASKILQEEFQVNVITECDVHELALQEHLYEFFIPKKPKDARDLAKELCVKPIYRAGFYLRQGHCDAVIAGCATPTSDVLKALVATVGTSKNTLTSGMMMVLKKPDEYGESFYVFSDCAVIPTPTAEQLCEMGHLASQAFLKWSRGKTPRVSFLSFSTAGSATHLSVERVKKGANLFKIEYPKILSFGETQFDAAVDKTIAKDKGNPLEGHTNVFIFPSLDAANITYKALQRIGQLDAFGPILLGTHKPYSDLSRGASSRDIVMTTLLTLANG